MTNKYTQLLKKAIEKTAKTETLQAERNMLLDAINRLYKNEIITFEEANKYLTKIRNNYINNRIKLEEEYGVKNGE